MAADVAVHFLIGLGAAGCGACARQLCTHRVRQLALGATLLMGEAYVSVLLVG